MMWDLTFPVVLNRQLFMEKIFQERKFSAFLGKNNRRKTKHNDFNICFQ